MKQTILKTLAIFIMFSTLSEAAHKSERQQKWEEQISQMKEEQAERKKQECLKATIKAETMRVRKLLDYPNEQSVYDLTSTTNVPPKIKAYLKESEKQLKQIIKEKEKTIKEYIKKVAVGM